MSEEAICCLTLIRALGFWKYMYTYVIVSFIAHVILWRHRVMPTKTIYVADADLPTFERAQALAGDNLSATIVQALRRFVQAHDAGRVDMELDVDIDLDGGFGAWRSERRSHGHAK